MTEEFQRCHAAVIGALDDLSIPEVWNNRYVYLFSVPYFDIPKCALVVADCVQVQTRLAKACRLGGYAVDRRSIADVARLMEGAPLPNLVLIDVPDAREDGLDCIARLRTRAGAFSLPIIGTCPASSPEATVSVLEAGADDVVLRPGSFDELLARMRSLIRRRSPELAPDEVSYGPLIVRPEAREVVALIDGESRLARVGPTEFRLLHFFATHPASVHSRASLRARLWPAHGHLIQERTIDAHINRLRRALADVGLQPSIETVLHLGYRLS